MIYVSNVGSVTAANSFVATNFFSTAITGYWRAGSISSPLTAFDRPYTEITQLYEVSGGKYPVHVYINQPRNVTGLMLYSTQPSKVRDGSGGYLYYTWYQVDYEYEVITFSEARWDDLLKVKPYTSDQVQWFHYYFWSALNTGRNNYDGLAIYPMFNKYSKFVQFSGMVPDDSDSGYSISGNGTHFNYEIPSTTFTLKVQMMVGGNGISFDQLIDDTANGAQMKLNYTSYCIGTPSLLGTAQGTSSNFVSTTALHVPTNSQVPTMKNYSRTLPDVNKPVLEEETTNDVKTWLASQSLEVAVEDTLRMTDGYAQTTFETDRPVAVYSDTTENVVGVYQPDAKMLPNPNTDCFFELPIDLKPVVSWEEFQYSYQKLSVWMHRSLPFLVFWGRELTCQGTDVTNTVFPTTFIKSKQVHNIYYLQRVRVPVYVASVYNWIPNAQVSQPLVPPNISVNEPYLPEKDTGDENITISIKDPKTPWVQFWEDFMALVSIPWVFGIGMLAGVAVLFVVKFVLGLLKSKTKLIRDLAKLGLGQPFKEVQTKIKRGKSVTHAVNAIALAPENRNASVYAIVQESSRKKKIVDFFLILGLGGALGFGGGLLAWGWVL